jgi:hypothetical protein
MLCLRSDYGKNQVQELFGGGGGVGRLGFLALFGLLGGAGAGVLSEGHGAENDAKADREYEKLLHEGDSP